MQARASWVRRFPMMAAGAAVLVGCASASIRSDPRSAFAQSPEPSRAARPAPDIDELRDQIIEAHNRIRTDAKQNTLEASKKLHAAAQAHALDMAENRKMSHRGSRGSTLTDRIKAKAYRYRRAGENVAAGRFTVERLMKGWMDSPHHKANILGGFSQIGVGCAIDEDGKRYWCVNFGLPAAP
jgi:uncharacterized protein YkwD